ncbi:hypothetical protein PVA48_04525 [Akkermansia sp. JRP_AM1]|uniref:hypothetical protein n=1 Tax=Akkermansia sp. JRP_AM1 TaxID=3414159 RepID=UPI003BFA6BED
MHVQRAVASPASTYRICFIRMRWNPSFILTNTMGFLDRENPAGLPNSGVRESSFISMISSLSPCSTGSGAGA